MDVDPSDNRLRASSPASHLWRWTVVDGNRALLVVVLAILTFLATLIVGLTGILPVGAPIVTQHILSRFVSSTLPFVTIVAAANQIVLTMDLGPLGQLRQQMEAMRDFRDEVEDTVGVTVSPTHPADFLELLTGHLVHCAELVERASADETVHEVVATLASEAHTLRSTLEEDNVTAFHAGAALLKFDPGWHLAAVRDIQTRPDLSEAAREHLETTARVLEQTDVARQYFKTLHTEHELASLSRAILFAGLPAIVGGSLLSLGYVRLAAQLGRPATLLLLAGTMTLVFLPFLIMVSYMFRIAEIARRTADFGPFVAD